MAGRIVEWHSRGKCGSCGDVMWTTDLVVPVSCHCGASKLYPEDTSQVLPVTDEEHKEAARQGVDLPPEYPITLVEI